jgi:UDP-N-acetylmuramoyl-L-alanyl-D-glutamate--2,6-diaminopimelate ligase
MNLLKQLIPKFVKRWYHLAWAILSILRYGRPSKKLKVIGVTGTDGKTTTTSLIFEGIKASGKKVAMLNGLEFVLPSKSWKNHSDNSTPGRFAIRKFLHQAVKEECEVVILEVTSWGLEQYRLLGVAIDVAIITNFAHEHLDLHGSMQRYRAMKGKLFKMLSSKRKEGQQKVAIINKDDESASFFARYTADKQVFYSRKEEADLFAKNISQEDGLVFDLVFEEKVYQVNLMIEGEFNVSNAIAAIAACQAVGCDLEKAISGVGQLNQVAGRMEFIKEGQDFHVVVDFAHTAQAFEAIFTSMRKKIGPDKKIIAVYGSAGGRDPGRRKMIGEIAGRLIDFSVLTTDDPRTEDPEAIAKEIVKGLESEGKHVKEDFIFVRDRAEAIETGIKHANTGDAVLMLSMGDYDVMYVGTGKIDWSDREAAKRALKKL